jgi:hypothetical protein
MEIKAWIEEHPYLTGGLVLGLIVLYFLLTSSSSSSAAASNGVGGTGLSSSDYTSLQEAQLQTGAQLQAQQNQATEQGNELSAELAATQINANATTTANQLEAQVQLQNIVSAGQVSEYGSDTTLQGTENTNASQVALGENTNSTNLQLAQAQIGGQVNLGEISAQENEYTAGTQASTLQAEYDAAVQSQGIISDAQTAQGAQNASTQQAIADYAAQVQLGTVNAAAGVQLAGIGATQEETDAATAAQLSAYQTGSNNQTSVDLAAVDAQGNIISQGLNYIKNTNPNAEQVSVFNTLFGQPSTVTGGNFTASTGPGASTVAAQGVNNPGGFGITVPGVLSFGAAL